MKGDIPIGVHVSEYVWVNSVFNRIIKNDGGLDDLQQKVIEMMAEIA